MGTPCQDRYVLSAEKSSRCGSHFRQLHKHSVGSDRPDGSGQVRDRRLRGRSQPADDPLDIERGFHEEGSGGNGYDSHRNGIPADIRPDGRHSGSRGERRNKDGPRFRSSRRGRDRHHLLHRHGRRFPRPVQKVHLVQRSLGELRHDRTYGQRNLKRVQVEHFGTGRYLHDILYQRQLHHFRGDQRSGRPHGSDGCDGQRNHGHLQNWFERTGRHIYNLLHQRNHLILCRHQRAERSERTKRTGRAGRSVHHGSREDIHFGSCRHLHHILFGRRLVHL